MPTPVLGISKQQQGTGLATILPVDPDRNLKLAEFVQRQRQQKAAQKAGFFKAVNDGIGEWSMMKDAYFKDRANGLIQRAADLWDELGENPMASTNPQAVEFRKEMSAIGNDAKKSMDLEQWHMKNEQMYQNNPREYSNAEEVLGHVYSTPFRSLLNNPLPKLQLRDPGGKILEMQGKIVQNVKSSSQDKKPTEKDIIGNIQIAKMDGSDDWINYWNALENKFNAMTKEEQNIYTNKAKAWGLSNGVEGYAAYSTMIQSGMIDTTPLDIMMEQVIPFQPKIFKRATETTGGKTEDRVLTLYDKEAILTKATQTLESFPSLLMNDPLFDESKTMRQNARAIAEANYDTAMATKEQKDMKDQGYEGRNASGKVNREAIAEEQFPDWYDKFKAGNIEAASLLFGDTILAGPQDVRVEDQTYVFSVRDPLLQSVSAGMSEEEINAIVEETRKEYGDDAADKRWMQLTLMQDMMNRGASKKVKEDGTFEILFDFGKMTKTQARNLFQRRIVKDKAVWKDGTTDAFIDEDVKARTNSEEEDNTWDDEFE